MSIMWLGNEKSGCQRMLASPFVIATEIIYERCVEMRNEIQKIGKAQNKGNMTNN